RAVGAHVSRPGLRAEGGRSRDHRLELRSVRSDHGEGRPPDTPRGRLGARVHAYLTTSAGLKVSSSNDQIRNLEPAPTKTCRAKKPALPLMATPPIGSQRPRQR